MTDTFKKFRIVLYKGKKKILDERPEFGSVSISFGKSVTHDVYGNPLTVKHNDKSKGCIRFWNGINCYDADLDTTERV